MAKTYSCPKCGGALVFDPDTQDLICKFCDESFTVQEMNESKLSLAEMIRKMKESAEKENADPEAEEIDSDEYETIAMNIMHCSSCGAKLAFSDVEMSSFCAYCGQPTVVTERMQNCRRPDFIVPFKVTKERAERLMREQIESGRFIPDEIRNFEPERICGIYIPYWLFDVYTSDGQIWKYYDDDKAYYMYNAADSLFRRVTCEASRRFNDYFSTKLEPYRTNDVKRFDPIFLSGFYSDQFDVDKEEAGRQACLRAGKMFEEEFTSRRKEFFYSATKIASHPVAEQFRARYALLPVWFMTTRYRDKPYTVLVNGQTGKTVCSLPVNKKKAYGLFASLAVGISALMMLIFTIINKKVFIPEMSEADRATIFAFIYIPIAIAFMGLYWISSIKRLFRLGKGVRAAASDDNEQLLNDRQEG